ncbi:hypothetical protein GCM10023195_80200 [Actinoallomurus liliacearum]|uniref:Lipoprotein n=1 Tax=Actinoallomurus liliacearum TaxID=1080073 RepID=A0ABP8TW72_9ACTN
MRVIHLRLAAFAVLVGVLCGGCGSGRSGHRSAVGPSVDRTSPAASPSVRPRSFTGVMVSAESTGGHTRVTYRPAKVRHVVDGYTEYLKVTATGPQATLELGPDARILLTVPLHGGGPAGSSVTPATFAAALARNKSQLPRIGFEIRIGADGRITYLEQIYQP